jgi:hypothetical protein
MKQYVYAATIPIQMDGPQAPPEAVPITILAETFEDAQQQAADAGLTFIGQVDAEGNVRKEPLV